MSIQAAVSSDEITKQVSSRFDGAFFEGRLINAPGLVYTPGLTDDSVFLSNEVTLGTGGYERQVIGYLAGDVSAFSDGGVGLTQKATVFSQDNSANSITFTHVALVESTGNVLTTAIPTAEPSPVINGTYEAIPVTSLSGSGAGLKIRLTIVSNVTSISIDNAGYGYAPGDSMQVAESTLVAAGVGNPGCGNLEFLIDTVKTNTETVFSVAQTANQVVLAGGNQAVFYWNIKLFNYSS